ncbi:MAG: 3-deoxy-7-phosphoheptulonate synthase, partial [Clostridia bacterium]|nr:3-deoxy-7-phosphoheptulonate synthase [Clostridia bacterium]
MFEKQIRIPEPEEIKDMLPLPKELAEIKSSRDKAISDVICGKSNKLIVIVGPCSAHAEKPVLDYVERLGKLNLKVEDKLVLVPRIYTNKPRTKG